MYGYAVRESIKKKCSKQYFRMRSIQTVYFILLPKNTFRKISPYNEESLVTKLTEAYLILIINLIF